MTTGGFDQKYVESDMPVAVFNLKTFSAHQVVARKHNVLTLPCMGAYFGKEFPAFLAFLGIRWLIFGLFMGLNWLIHTLGLLFILSSVN